MSDKKVQRSKARLKSEVTAQSEDNKGQLNAAFKWFRGELDFADLRFHGNTSWRPIDLILLALVWAISEKGTLTESFTTAKAQVFRLGEKIALKTYQGMLGALVTWTEPMMVSLKLQFHGLLQQFGKRFFRVGRWAPLAFDGSRATAPRTKSNEREFCAKNYGNGKTGKYRRSLKGRNQKKKHRKNEAQLTPPQLWVTLIWHIGFGVIWDWRLGPSTASERDHVKDMVKNGHFAKDTIFVGDAGFIGYDLWRTIIDQGHQFMVRVGGNVRLLTELGGVIEQQSGRLKRGRLVHCWPNDKMRQQQPPLSLRLVKCKIGNANVWLLTSVLNEEDLTIEMMQELYKRRWGIEVEFRSLKQIFERRKMRSHNAARVYVEMHWSIMAMIVLELFALKEQFAHAPRKTDPQKISFAKALRAIRRALEFPENLPPDIPDFKRELQKAIVDNCERKSKKKARYRPKRKRPPSCGQPIIMKANQKQRKAQQLLNLAHAP